MQLERVDGEYASVEGHLSSTGTISFSLTVGAVAELGEERADGAGLHATASTDVAQLSRFNVVLPARH